MLSHKKHLNGFVLAVCLMLVASFSFAQGKNEAGSSSKGNAYYYPNFKKGTVTFITGTANTGILNYNVLNEEIAYINTRKDTLTFDQMYLIDKITIDSDTFYYDTHGGSVLKLLKNINGRKLLVKENPGNNASTIAKTYYVTNKSDYVPASTPNIINLFPSHASTLRKYIEEHNLKLKSEEEISKLLEYAANL
ncbi:hypothetical protein JAO76_04100 [Pontibacter sp. BT310]|uniref:DUF4369 domain-containing protein n=1 Tax=Pontibacter populi TaxID=890055 RepID=A0ABS6X882_9BACT|nr:MULTISPECIES: hypothetical protein [Pontibacter]MBJ6117359.1 hypothetical protein [Pontibacter sp. BT310]MBR0569784.1 hypothetical protein [Microvirga sp. STS03]MBW3364212.1 hypothetical protein [Pontibacter populi]